MVNNQIWNKTVNTKVAWVVFSHRGAKWLHPKTQQVNGPEEDSVFNGDESKYEM
jgi:hypothetical protein